MSIIFLSVEQDKEKPEILSLSMKFCDTRNLSNHKQVYSLTIYIVMAFICEFRSTTIIFEIKLCKLLLPALKKI